MVWVVGSNGQLDPSQSLKFILKGITLGGAYDIYLIIVHATAPKKKFSISCLFKTNLKPRNFLNL